MKLSFDTILVPVDFTINTEVAIKKAIVLSKGAKVSIHLLYVAKPARVTVFSLHQYFAKYSFSDTKIILEQAQERLDRLRSYTLDLKSDAEVSGWIAYGLPVEETIIKKAKQINADLIVIGKSSHHSILPMLNTVAPSRIARKTGVAVFTAKPGAVDQSIRTVVVAVGSDFPDTKLAVINELRKKFSIQIRLVAFARNDRFLPAQLLDAYRFLKSNPAINVSYKLLRGAHRAKEIVRYCQLINADVLVVDPDTETRMGWFNSHISDVLPAQSRTQVLAVQPA